MKYFTLLQLNKSIQKLINGINQDFWITAELANVQRNDHYYLELVQKEKDQIVAKARGMLWAYQVPLIEKKLGFTLDELLVKGRKILIKVKVTFHEVHGTSLQINEVEAGFTVGELELKRIETLEKLSQTGLLNAQKALKIPLVPRRIALVSSQQAAGYTDFMRQLAENPFGYVYQVQLFEANVQGEKATATLIAALESIPYDQFDVCALIRGGGSRLDLETFNQLELSVCIAGLPIPVITGIGHERDQTVADLAAHAFFRTPTAVAEFLVRKTHDFELNLQAVQERIVAASMGYIQQQKLILEGTKAKLAHQAQKVFHANYNQLQRISDRIASHLALLFQKQKLQLKAMEASIKQLDPQRILARGYSLTLYKGKVPGPDNPPALNEKITTLTRDFVLTSTVTSTKQRSEG